MSSASESLGGAADLIGCGGWWGSVEFLRQRMKRDMPDKVMVISGILILTDAIDPVWGSEKTCQAGWEAGYQVGNERGFSTGYHEALSNATEGFWGPFS